MGNNDVSALQTCTVITSDVDFPSLLHTAIYAEDESELSKSFPAATNTESSSSKRKNSESSATNYNTTNRSSPSVPSRQHKRRRQMRNNEILKEGYQTSIRTKTGLLENAQLVQTTLDTITLPVVKGARTALNKPVPENPRDIPEIKELLDNGFEYIPCGKNGVPSNIPRPIVDRNGVIVAHVAAAPQGDATYNADAKDTFNIIIEELDTRTFSKREWDHKRGDFPAINFGFTLPNGPFEHPINLKNDRYEEKIKRISTSPGFGRISSYQNAAFAFWNPGVYIYQKSRIEQVLARDPTLQRTTPKTIFPTTACNFRNVCCYRHRDTQNNPFGWCAVTALGNFDHTRGGHLVLWELKLVIEFPHGYTILLPSATITHSNIPVIAGDVRVSITQYCAGSVLRYADNGFRLDKTLKAEDSARYDEAQELKEHMWKMSLGLLSTMDGLRRGKIPTIGAFQ